ncbi:MAG: ORF6N domain-containing protein, partial [Prolixibacteraceae bacterium]
MKKGNNSELMLPDEKIASKIYLIRGEKVMLDRDLANLFEVKAIRLREQVRRNKEKFPGNFMFQLTEQEVEIMVSQ